MSHPVQERHHHGPRADGRREVGDGVVQRGRLDRQQHDVRGPGQLSGHDQVRPHLLPGIGSSSRPNDPQPALAQLLGAARADQERYVPAGLREPCPEIATGGARPDNEDRHGLPASSRIPGERGPIYRGRKLPSGRARRRLTRKAQMRMQSVTGLADSPEERPVRVIRMMTLSNVASRGLAWTRGLAVTSGFDQAGTTTEGNDLANLRAASALPPMTPETARRLAAILAPHLVATPAP